MPQIHDGSDSGAGKDGEVTAILMAVMAPTCEHVDAHDLDESNGAWCYWRLWWRCW